MRCSPSRLLAAAAQTPTTTTALLPPIPLYRRLLRAHRRHLPAEMRLLGDEYVKAEFRLHRRVENPGHVIKFLHEWQVYVQKIEGEAWAGARVDEGLLGKMSDEQTQQLHDLMQAIRSRGAEGDHGSSGA